MTSTVANLKAYAASGRGRAPVRRVLYMAALIPAAAIPRSKSSTIVCKLLERSRRLSSSPSCERSSPHSTPWFAITCCGATVVPAGTPCRPHDKPTARRAGQIKAVAARSAGARSASLDAARTMGNSAPGNNTVAHSIISAALASSGCEKLMPSAFAVFRLIRSSNLTG